MLNLYPCQNGLEQPYNSFVQSPKYCKFIKVERQKKYQNDHNFKGFLIGYKVVCNCCNSDLIKSLSAFKLILAFAFLSKIRFD